VLRFGFLSTFPPTRCGIATFTDSLASAVEAELGAEARIVRLLDADEAAPAAPVTADLRVAADLVPVDPASMRGAVESLDACDVVVVQHEFGIYGGVDGDEVITVLRALRAPAIVVLHTVLRSPTPGQRAVLEQVCALAATVVVMTETARRLLAGYAVATEKVRVIPHGVHARTSSLTSVHETRARVLTWGLIGPGKGIEWAIRAMAQLDDLDPRPTYQVLGQTHPKVVAKHGERYRDSLQALVDELGLTERVALDDRYLDPAALAEAVDGADVVVLPYDSRDQVTSGVLVEAIAAGIPVVATGFPHARELLHRGPGIVVAHEDPGAIARAVRAILTRGELAARMRRAASAATAETSWADVARRYGRVASKLRSVVAA
jgi:glycosyltransferase involved in cell wall biosynthesis